MVFTTELSTPPEKKNIFFTSVEYENLQALADELNLPIGNLLVQLAQNERQRLRIEKLT